MKKLLNVYQSATNIDVALLITRVSVAALMLAHGWPKLGMLLSNDPVQFPALLGLSATVALALAVFAEVVCSLLILVGLGTRLATNYTVDHHDAGSSIPGARCRPVR